MLEEHFNPVDTEGYLADQHTQRYAFALARLEPGETVLDIACGSGYGTDMIRRIGCEVVGADYNPETVRHAKSSYPESRFCCADALELPFADKSFSTILSFETIEHVVDGDAFLAEMRRVLRPGGRLFCSTPNIRYTAHPVFHLKEYRPEEFFSLFEKRFSEVRRFGQYFLTVDRIRDLLRRRARSLVSPFIRGLGLKPTIDKLRASLKGSQSPVSNGGVNGPARQPDGPSHHSPYKVREIHSNRLLRIMIAVGYRERE